jgi:hypothetical protein
MDAKKDIIEKLRAFDKAASELAEAWSQDTSKGTIDEALIEDYPFDHCFIELAEEIGWWVAGAIDRLGDEQESQTKV